VPRYLIGLPLLLLCACGGGGGGGGAATTFAFVSGSYTVAENGAVTIAVQRSGPGRGAASVQYSAAGATATAGTDFPATSGSLSWADGETGQKTFAFAATDDALDEGDETVALTLSDPSGGALGPQDTATVTIDDNDAAGARIVGLAPRVLLTGTDGATVTVVGEGLSPTPN